MSADNNDIDGDYNLFEITDTSQYSYVDINGYNVNDINLENYFPGANDVMPFSGTIDPAFVDATNNDYHLTASSSALNVGDNAAVVGLDIDGETRIQQGTVDMGADETPYTSGTAVSGVFVDSNTSSVNCDAYLAGRTFDWKVLGTGETGSGTVGAGGAFSFSPTSTGTVDICLKVFGALSRKLTGVSLSGSVSVGNVSVTLPDILNDDIWDDFDLNEINGGFGNTVTPGDGADYNCDGVYDDFDLNQINGGFGSTGECYGL